jgi:predicted membrane protein
MIMRRTIVGLLTLFATCGLAGAQVSIDRSLPVSSSPEVTIENMFGSIEIRAWTKDEVRVTGRLASAAEGLEFDVDENEVEISIDAAEHWFYESDDDTEFRSQLLIQLPQGSSVGIESLNASIEIDGVRGVIEIETINGSVTVSGDPSSVEIESMTGNVEVQAVAAEMEVESVSGDVTLYGARATVSVESISGNVIVQGSSLEEISIETVSGNVSVDGSLTAEGDVDVETHSGHVELTFPADVRARFSLSTFNGSIDSVIGPTPRKTSRFEPYTELRFANGSDDFDVSVETFSGNITVRTR